MRNELLMLRQRCVMFVGNHPVLFFTLVRLKSRLGRGHGGVLVSRDTNLVIEGFLRSANSFATRAFLRAQPGKVIVANRTHAPATIIQAARWNIPTLVLIREPMDVVLSYMLKRPHVSAQQGLKEYVNFYSRIAPYRDHYIVASFETVTTDFGTAIGRLNERFGTNFAAFSHEEEDVRAVFDVIERNDRETVGDDLGKLSVPLPERQALKDRLLRVMDDEQLQPSIIEAQELYREFVSYSVRADPATSAV